MLAVGPPSCLRDLFQRVFNKEFETRLFLMPVTIYEYESGEHIKKIKRGLRKLKEAGAEVVILYVTCADILSATDLSKLCSKEEQNLNIQIKALMRGPLSKRKIKPSERLKAVLNEVDLSEINTHIYTGNIEGIKRKIPVMASDYSGAESVLLNLDMMNVLCTPGGCANSIISFGEIGQLDNRYLYRTCMSEIDVVMGCEEHILNSITNTLLNKNVNAVSLTGTPVTSITGISMKNICRKIEKNLDKKSIFINCNGFSNYAAGADMAFSNLCSTFLKKCEKSRFGVNILGYTLLGCGTGEKLNELRKVLSECGLHIEYDSSLCSSIEEFKKAAKAELNIVISEAGINSALYMKEYLHISYIIINPIGCNGMQKLFKYTQSIFEFSIDENIKDRYTKESPIREASGEAVVIGESVFASAMAECLANDYGIKNVRVICNLPKENRLKDIYNCAELKNIEFIDDENKIEKILNSDEVEIIVGDPLFKRLLNKNKVFIDIPHIGLSGCIYKNINYEYIGKGGDDYIKQYIKN